MKKIVKKLVLPIFAIILIISNVTIVRAVDSLYAHY